MHLLLRGRKRGDHISGQCHHPQDRHHKHRSRASENVRDDAKNGEQEAGPEKDQERAHTLLPIERAYELANPSADPVAV